MNVRSLAANPTDPVGSVCPICPHACQLAENQLGICGARRAHKDKVVASNYGKLTALALDPIEKKPLAHFYPKSMILSVGSYGCNLNCTFCQNSSISRMRGDSAASHSKTITPQELVSAALAAKTQGNIGIAYTYNEPLVGYEFVFDTAKLAHTSGLKNVIVSNGYIKQKPFCDLLPYLDAANIDLKAFHQDFYNQVGAPQGLATVKRSIELAARSIHVEVTTLIIPGLNDSEDEMDKLASWLASLCPTIPLHLNRFFPCYRMQDRPPTSRESILHLVGVAKTHLTYVYAGNL